MCIQCLHPEHNVALEVSLINCPLTLQRSAAIHVVFAGHPEEEMFVDDFPAAAAEGVGVEPASESEFSPWEELREY